MCIFFINFQLSRTDEKTITFSFIVALGVNSFLELGLLHYVFHKACNLAFFICIVGDLMWYHCSDWLLIVPLNLLEQFILVFSNVLERKKILLFLLTQCILPLISLVQWRVVDRWESLEFHRIIKELSLFLLIVFVSRLRFLFFFLFYHACCFNLLRTEGLSHCSIAACVLIWLFHTYGLLPHKVRRRLIPFIFFVTHPSDTSTCTIIFRFLIFLIVILIILIIFYAAIVVIWLISIAWGDVLEIYCRVSLF